MEGFNFTSASSAVEDRVGRDVDLSCHALLFGLYEPWLEGFLQPLLMLGAVTDK